MPQILQNANDDIESENKIEVDPEVTVVSGVMAEGNAIPGNGKVTSSHTNMMNSGTFNLDELESLVHKVLFYL